MTKKRPFSSELLFWGDLREDALRARSTYGVTNRYRTGNSELDRYLFGGFGRTGNYEIMVLHGNYKVGKSTVGINMLRGAIEDGVKIGMFVLEDDLDTTAYRMAMAIDDPKMVHERINDNTVRFLPRKKGGRNRWALSDMLAEIEKWFTDPKYGVEIIFLDHIQFMFDNAENNHDYGQWAAQNTFMHDLNDLMDRVRKTIIIISQENREGNIAGSIGIPRAASKLIRVSRIEHEPDTEIRAIQLEPSRHTPERGYVFRVRIRNGRMAPDTNQPEAVRNEKKNGGMFDDAE